MVNEELKEMNDELKMINENLNAEVSQVGLAKDSSKVEIDTETQERVSFDEKINLLQAELKEKDDKISEGGTQY